MNYCLVIPHYNQIEAFLAFLPQLSRPEYLCLVIDDGSDDSAWSQLSELADKLDNVQLYRHPVNRGKGAAVITGACLARVQGFTHMVQIDADGQHNAADIPRFIAASQAQPDTIVSGKPIFDDSAPKARVYGRKITDFWVAIETLSLDLQDSLCGFRVYPLHAFEQVNDRYFIGKHMEFDTDILVKSVWEGIAVRFIETHVVYFDNHPSHFHYWRDNWRLIRLHTRLMLGMMASLPGRLLRRIRRR